MNYELAFKPKMLAFGNKNKLYCTYLTAFFFNYKLFRTFAPDLINKKEKEDVRNKLV